jgi:hypothetical protein
MGQAIRAIMKPMDWYRLHSGINSRPVFELFSICF